MMPASLRSSAATIGARRLGDGPAPEWFGHEVDLAASGDALGAGPVTQVKARRAAGVNHGCHVPLPLDMGTTAAIVCVVLVVLLI